MLALLLVAVALAACGSGGDEKSSGSDTLTIGIGQELASLNPGVDGGTSGAGFILYLPYATLVTKDAETGEYGPGLAEKFGYIGEGNTVFEMTLRSGVKYADGTPMDAAAVKAWLDYFPNAGGGFSKLLDIDSVEAVDDRTVRINLATPSPLMMENLSGPWGMVIAPEALKDPAQLAKGAPGAGPYAYDPASVVTGKGATYTLVPNEFYFDQEAIKWDKVVIKVIEDPATRLRALQAGQLDVATGNVGTLDSAEKAGFSTSVSSWGWSGVTLLDAEGARTRALGDVRVRQALNYALDRKAITESLFEGAVEPTSELSSPDGFVPELQDYYDYDPAKAKALLADAGYPDGFTMGIVAPNFGTLTGSPLTQAIAQNWADVGVKLKVVEVGTNAELFEKYQTQSALILDYADSPMSIVADNRFTKGGSFNAFGVEDSVVTRLYDESLRASPERLTELSQQMTRHIVQQGYLAPIALRPQILFSAGNVTGVEAKPYQLQSPVVLGWSPTS
ncbi:MAG: ABC transporter substrate-binding protein [Actinomycetota bacterium]|nr:ABC transporter substrate-binding protein [Actinomycetota bacterium]